MVKWLENNRQNNKSHCQIRFTHTKLLELSAITTGLDVEHLRCDVAERQYQYCPNVGYQAAYIDIALESVEMLPMFATT